MFLFPLRYSHPGKLNQSNRSVLHLNSTIGLFSLQFGNKLISADLCPCFSVFLSKKKNLPLANQILNVTATDIYSVNLFCEVLLQTLTQMALIFRTKAIIHFSCDTSVGTS